MSHSLYKVVCAASCLFALAACTSTGTQPDTDAPLTLAMATQTLRDSGIHANPAVEGLIQQADALIENDSLELAEEKIERALRISPDYAPGWSRLSQIALSRNDPSRAIQMATRSNSYAGNAVALKRLNWRIIREARLSLNDPDGVAKADAVLRRLQ